MKNILMYGATDRFNYGDLLFPIIIKKKFKEYHNKKNVDFNISNYGIIENNLSKYGALPTESLDVFYEKCNENNIYIVIVGGEILSAQWGNIYSYLNPNFNKLYTLFLRIFKRFSYPINNGIAKYILKGQTKKPFIFEIKKFEGVKQVIYNSVGGLGGRKKISKKIINELKNADYISCRENRTYKNLKQYISNVKLAPDSAILMSSIFKKNTLKQMIRISDIPENYIFFQISKSELQIFTLNFIIEKLKSIYYNHSKNIVLCPIGTALGHEDHKALEQISKHLQFKHTLIENPTIWDIMFLIANTSLYIGSSLHGTITAMSFSVPYLAIRNVPKITAYLATWAIPELNEITIAENWDNQYNTATTLISKKSLVENRDLQIKLSEQSMKEIFSLITVSK